MESIFDSSRVREVLSSSAYPPYPMSSVYEHITEKTGLDFTATVTFLRQLPVFIEGNSHAEVRRVMALLLKSRRKDMEIALDEEIGRLIDSLFKPGRQFDLVADFSAPLWRTAMSFIVSENDLPLASEIATLFDPDASPRRRYAINMQIRAFLSDPSPERLTGMALAALGVKPFVGSLALSVYETIAHHKSTLLSDMQWLDHLPVSAIRFIERIHRPQSSGVNKDDHQLIRCNLHHSSFSGHSNVAATFGHGPHICLGKGLTELAWKGIVGRLRATRYIAQASDLEMAPSEKPFYMPAAARVTIREA